jgi:hypothetical protein
MCSSFRKPVPKRRNHEPIDCMVKKKHDIHANDDHHSNLLVETKEFANNASDCIRKAKKP